MKKGTILSIASLLLGGLGIVVDSLKEKNEHEKVVNDVKEEVLKELEEQKKI